MPVVVIVDCGTAVAGEFVRFDLPWIEGVGTSVGDASFVNWLTSKRLKDEFRS